MSQIVQCNRCKCLMGFDSLNTDMAYEDGWFVIGTKARYDVGELEIKAFSMDLCKTCVKLFKKFMSGVD